MDVSCDFHLFDDFRLLAAKYRPHGVYKDARSIIVIHNLAHQVTSVSFDLLEEL